MKQTDVICEVPFCTAPFCSPQFKARCALRKAYLEITPSLIVYSLPQIHQMGYLTLREFAIMRQISLTTAHKQAKTGIYLTKKFTIKFGTRRKPGQTLCITHPDYSPTNAPQVYADETPTVAGGMASTATPKQQPTRLRKSTHRSNTGSQASRLPKLRKRRKT